MKQFAIDDKDFMEIVNIIHDSSDNCSYSKRVLLNFIRFTKGDKG